MFKSQIRTMTRGIAPRFFAERRYRKDPRPGAPLNGQAGRQSVVREILGTCGIEQIVETGTYRGTTTEWFAAFGLPVLSVEIDPIYGHFSALRLAGVENVKLSMGDSIAFLRALAETDATRLTTLFYLDAHWREHLPLGDELRIIAAAFPSAVAVIDDFAVPGDSGYGFDDYGPGRRLDLAYVARNIAVPEVYFPTLPAADETGHRRGYVVIPIGPEMSARLANVGGLRRHAPGEAAPSPA